MVELLGVVVHGPSSLLEVHELLALLPHHACRDVVGVESIVELSPWHLVIRGASDGVVGPPHASVTPHLLRGEEGLLHLGAAQEPELGLHHPKPVVGLQRLSCLGEQRRVSGREVVVGSRSWSGSIPCPIATMGRVGNELLQQLGLLVTGLKDRGDRLSQTWRWRRVPVPWEFSAPARPLRVFTILSFQHVTISLEIKLSITTNLSNGKGDNLIITENMVNSVRTVQPTQFSCFYVLTARIRSKHKQAKCREITQLSNGYLHWIQQTV
jgi:hypothetical protein